MTDSTSPKPKTAEEWAKIAWKDQTEIPIIKAIQLSIEGYAQQEVQAEREACAKVADEWYLGHNAAIEIRKRKGLS